MHNRSMRAAALVAVALLAVACQHLGFQAETFNERLAVGYSTVTAARESAASLLIAGKVSVEDARHVQAQADNARAGLDVARAIHAASPDAAEEKLTAILAGLEALSNYLRSRQ